MYSVDHGNLTGPPDISVGPNNEMQIVYNDNQSERITRIAGDTMLARGGYGSWDISTLDRRGNTGWDPQLAVDRFGVAHISANEESADGPVYYQAPTGVEPTSSALNAGPSPIGSGTSIGLDQNGIAFIAFYEEHIGVYEEVIRGIVALAPARRGRVGY